MTRLKHTTQIVELTLKLQCETSKLLCDYSGAYSLVQGSITALNTAYTTTAANNADRKVTLKSCASFTDCISAINNTQVDNAKNIDVVMPM